MQSGLNLGADFLGGLSTKSVEPAYTIRLSSGASATTVYGKETANRGEAGPPQMNLPLTFPLQKPEQCLACPYNLIGQGFVPDHVPSNPRLAFLAEAAGETEMMDRGPLLGATGRMFFHQLLHPVGLTREDVILANVLRCHPPENVMPIGQLRKDAEKMCRMYDKLHQIKHDDSVGLVDGGLHSYSPDYFLITVHPSFVNRTWSILRVAQEDIKKSLRLAEGRRLLVLLGDTPMKLVCSDLEGGVLKWRGHHGVLDWKKFQERFK